MLIPISLRLSLLSLDWRLLQLASLKLIWCVVLPLEKLQNQSECSFCTVNLCHQGFDFRLAESRPLYSILPPEKQNGLFSDTLNLCKRCPRTFDAVSEDDTALGCQSHRH